MILFAFILGYYNPKNKRSILSFQLPFGVFKEDMIDSVELVMRVPIQTHFKTVYLTDSRRYLIFLNKTYRSEKLTSNGEKTWRMSFSRELKYRHIELERKVRR